MVSLLPALPQEDRQEIGRTRLVRTEGKREAASTKKSPGALCPRLCCMYFLPFDARNSDRLNNLLLEY